MLSNIIQTNKIHFNLNHKKNKTTESKNYELFPTKKSEEEIEANKHTNFSDIPQEILNIISDFLEKKDVLNKILPLSKKIFETVMENQFKLKIPTNDGYILEIGYKKFLSNQILILKERIANDPMHGISPLATWKKLHYATAVVRNLPKSLCENYSPNNNNVAFATAVISYLFELMAYFFSQKNTKNPHILIDDIIIRTHLVSFVFACISIAYFIMNETSNPHLLPTSEQKNFIEQQASAAYAQKKLTELEHHLEELMTLFDSQ